jgi:DNA-binding beta-propeller fold protein YncE
MKYPAILAFFAAGLTAQPQSAPEISYEGQPDFLKLPPEMNFGEVAGVAVNSKGHVFAFNRGAREQLLEFDATGKFLREIGKDLYAFAAPSSFGAHSVRVDKSDNIWAVDSVANMVIKFNPEGRVLMTLGRKPEPGPVQIRLPNAPPPPRPEPEEGFFNGPTDVAFDAAGDIFVSDGYRNSRVVKIDKSGKWVKTWGERGSATGQFNAPHSIAVDDKGLIYVADRGNRRIQIFDDQGKFVNQWPVDAGALCITPGPKQVLYTTDLWDRDKPQARTTSVRVYKMDLNGKALGVFGRAGKQAGEIGWTHEMTCPSENTIYLAELLNWRVQKLTLHPER